MKLYCGEVEDYQTWAVTKTMPIKGAEIVFINEYRSGEPKDVGDMNNMALMYPFKVFKTAEADVYNMLRQLRHLLLYLFLANGHAHKVFPSNLGGPKNQLSWAVNRIKNVYDKHSKSVPCLIIRPTSWMY